MRSSVGWGDAFLPITGFSFPGQRAAGAARPVLPPQSPPGAAARLEPFVLGGRWVLAIRLATIKMGSRLIFDHLFSLIFSNFQPGAGF